MDKTIVVTHINGDNTYTIEVGAASIHTGMRRNRIASEMRRMVGQSDDVDKQLIAYSLYPDLIAPVVRAEGFEQWPVSLDEFMALQDIFAIKWEKAVYALNPHWLPGYESEEATAKKNEPQT